MRILTPDERRQIELLKRELTNMPAGGIELLIDNREMWFNLVTIILEANEAMSVAWRRSANPRTNLVELVNMALSGDLSQLSISN